MDKDGIDHNEQAAPTFPQWKSKRPQAANKRKNHGI
jgi:hypothetical protein